MQQLNLFEPRLVNTDVPIWTALDEKQQAAVVTKLAELIAKIAVCTDEEPHND